MIAALTRLAGDSPLSKTIHLNADGTLSNDSSNLALYHGRATRLPVTSMAAFAAVLDSTPTHGAFALGTLRVDLPDEVEIATEATLTKCPRAIVRNLENFLYQPGQAGFVLLDFDRKQMPAHVQTMLENLGGFEGALTTICPGITTAATVLRESTSAGIYNVVTDEIYGSGGLHFYVVTADVSDIKRFLTALQDRAWLAGLGWYFIGKSGVLSARSIVDTSVGSPERIVFEAAPVLGAGLKQAPRQSTAHEGLPLDTRVCLDLTPTERETLKRLQAAERVRLEPERRRVRETWVEARCGELVARSVPADAARLASEQWAEGDLGPDVILHFDKYGLMTVANVLADPDRLIGETLADPLEGLEYGRQTAKVLRRPDRSVFIKSFAHGGCHYELKHDFASIAAAIADAPDAAAARILCDLVPGADLDPAEVTQVLTAAAERCGTGVRDLRAMLKDARNRRDKHTAKQARESHRAESRRVCLDVPADRAPAGPVMVEWDAIRSHVDVPEPPMRDVSGWPVEIRTRASAGLHELTAKGANDEEDETSRLLVPSYPLLTSHDRFSLEIEIGDHIDFVAPTKLGCVSVAPPERLVTHYLKYGRSNLPVVNAVMTMPLVLPNGQLLARNGLVREHRTVFRIDPALLEFVPAPGSCTDDAVALAFKFLCDEWLVDVLADMPGKCVLIAHALSIVERTLLPERPAFFVTAGRRGGGKTTALSMSIAAVTGKKPAAAAWSTEEEERRKAILTYLMDGLPALVWDNIPLGGRVSSAALDRALTSEIYQDRILGENRRGEAPAFTIMSFTGNNIGPKGDLASRSLVMRLVINRADPENRKFVHPDPIAWTLDHRGEILKCLYTILLGNPQLAQDCYRADETRFKMWWRLVGSAVEHAASTSEVTVSFKSLFGDTEDEAETNDKTGVVLAALLIAWPAKADGEPTKFLASDVVASCQNATEENAVLRNFCTPPNAHMVMTPHSVGYHLNSIIDTPIWLGSKLLCLRFSKNRHESKQYWIEVMATATLPRITCFAKKRRPGNLPQTSTFHTTLSTHNTKGRFVAMSS